MSGADPDGRPESDTLSRESEKARRSRDGWQSMATCPGEEGAKAHQILVWHVYQMCMVYDGAKARENRFILYWMEIPEEWIPVAERRPDIRDANPLGVVIIKDRHGNVRLRRWRSAGNEAEITHWMPTPMAPDNYKELRREFDLRKEG